MPPDPANAFSSVPVTRARPPTASSRDSRTWQNPKRTSVGHSSTRRKSKLRLKGDPQGTRTERGGSGRDICSLRHGGYTLNEKAGNRGRITRKDGEESQRPFVTRAGYSQRVVWGSDRILRGQRTLPTKTPVGRTPPFLSRAASAPPQPPA